jgi:hypothetical protein
VKASTSSNFLCTKRESPMTEAKWLACTDPQRLLDFLRDKASARKLRLFAVACCRRVSHRIRQPVGRQAVEVAEKFADGLARKRELKAAQLAAAQAADFPAKRQAFQVSAAAWAAAYAADADAFAAAEEASGAAREASLSRAELQCRSRMKVTWPPDPEQVRARAEAVWGRESRAQCALLREIFGPLPFREIHLPPSWLKWNSCTIPKLARSIYEGGVFGDLPVLADALEEAGCTDEGVLTHWREGGGHARGCWVLDLLLGKE